MEEETQDDLDKTDTDKQDEEDPKSTDQTESELTSDLVLPVESKTEPEDFTSEVSLGIESLPSTSSASTDLLSVPEVSKTKIYLKPPVSPELMIAIAVRNLDPQKVVGASCSDIVAFLSLHFPYFTDNYQECKVRHHIRSRVMT